MVFPLAVVLSCVGGDGGEGSDGGGDGCGKVVVVVVVVVGSNGFVQHGMYCTTTLVHSSRASRPQGRLIYQVNENPESPSGSPHLAALGRDPVASLWLRRSQRILSFSAWPRYIFPCMHVCYIWEASIHPTVTLTFLVGLRR